MINDSSKELIIIGASGLGKEIAWISKRLNIKVKGFLDDDTSKVDVYYGYPLLGSIKNWRKYNNVQFIIAIASPRIRHKIYFEHFFNFDANFATLIDPAVQWLSGDLEIGQGSVVCAGTVCTADVKVGDFSIINKQCSIGHDVMISDFCTISPSVILSGHVNISESSEVGASTSIRQGVTIGRNSLIGMGSVVLNSIEQNTLAFGSPAKFVKKV